MTARRGRPPKAKQDPIVVEGEKIQLPQLKPKTEVAAPSEAAAILSVIQQAAANPAVDVEKMKSLLEMSERIKAKEAEQAFHRAMTQAQAEMRPVAADASNPQTNSNYASYAALDRALRPIYTRHGFSLSFDTEVPADSIVRVICHVAHAGGWSRTHKTDMPADGLGAKGGQVMTRTHAAGSAMTYGMRYLLKLIFNVAVGEDDDDGNSAEGIARVSEEQVKSLEKLIEDVGASYDAFTKYLKVSNLKDLRADRYQHAVDALERKR